MMAAMDTRNMYSDFALNKYLHTVASCWILLITGLYSFLQFPFPRSQLQISLLECDDVWSGQHVRAEVAESHVMSFFMLKSVS